LAKTFAVVIAVALAIFGCSHGSAHGPAATSPSIDSLLEGVPGNAAALGFVDLDVAPWSQVIGNMVPLDESARASLDKELREYLVRTLGLDPSKVQYAVVFVTTPMPRAAVLVKTIHGSPKLPGSTDYAGAKLWQVDADVSVAVKGDIAIFGHDDAVRASIDTLVKKTKSVTTENKALVDWLHHETHGAAIAMAAVVPKGLPLPPQLAGLERVAVTIGKTGLRAAVEGDDAAITRLETQVNAGLAELTTNAQRAHDRATKDGEPVLEGASAIVAAAYAKSLATKLKPRHEGHRLVSSLDVNLGGYETTTIVAITGVMAAVAIPAFMDYMKKAKKPEAVMQLNRISKSAKIYFIANDRLPSGQTSLTPAQSCCSGPQGKCVTTPQDWQQPIWQTLEFSIDEPGLYQYRYESDGKTATVEAIGDLDCDGQSATYRLDLTTDQGMVNSTITEPPRGTF
jgi:hypothetical protein